MKTFDAIIIGSGQGGTPLSKKLAKAGWKTALIEKRFVGGTCINDGCTPTKSMVASAKMAYEMGRSEELGITAKGITVDIDKIVQRKNAIVSSFRNGMKEKLLHTENLDLIEGVASFTGTKTLQVIKNDKSIEDLSAQYIFIDTGGKTAIPNIAGLDSIPYLTSTTILDIKVVPKHLLILGGSYIGLEFGQMFKRFGSEVTIIDTSSRFLPHEDEDISDKLLEIIRQEGVLIHVNSKVNKFTNDAGNISVDISIDNNPRTTTCSHVLIAAGRTPQTEELQLQKTGIETDDRGYIKVNERLETNVSGIYALGDVKGGPAFTHISYNDYVVIAQNLLEDKNISFHDRMVPYCMFTDPQLGRIGITEQDAQKKGLHYKVARLEMQHVARAIETSETRGLIKAIVDADTKQILGAAVIGEQGGELMAMLQLAMMGKIPYDDLSFAIFAHPTYAESLNNLFSQLN
ncbi:MAG: mercuric reductase [Ilyomonas sp.]